MTSLPRCLLGFVSVTFLFWIASSTAADVAANQATCRPSQRHRRSRNCRFG